MPVIRALLVYVGFALLVAGTDPGSRATPLPLSISPHLGDGPSGDLAAGMFLVARRELRDPNFRETVIYLLEHGKNGTLGLVVNRPSNIALSDAVEGIEQHNGHQHALYIGGPVGIPQILMLMRNSPDSPLAEHVAGNIYVSGDRSLLDQLLAADKSGDQLRFYLGHAGWAAGQLAFELLHLSWYVIDADPNAIFSRNPSGLWETLIEDLEPTGIQVRDDRPATPVTPSPAHRPAWYSAAL